jgi:hypothetical protein
MEKGKAASEAAALQGVAFHDIVAEHSGRRELRKAGMLVAGKRKTVREIVYEDAPQHPYTMYESHPYWRRVNKAIADLVENQDWWSKQHDLISLAISASCC